MAPGMKSESLGHHHPCFHGNRDPALLYGKIWTLDGDILGRLSIPMWFWMHPWIIIAIVWVGMILILAGLEKNKL